MSAFDYIDGKKIDLNNQVHRDVVMQRNKALQQAVENGLETEDKYESKCKVLVRITVEIDCLKCGDHMESVSDDYLDDVADDLEHHVPTVKCLGCGTKYSYDPPDQKFYLSVPKPKLQKIINK